MHVLLFSDNVSLEDENELKDFAIQQGLLMMGPDCGTAIINGVALGFANVVRRGGIGLVAASGTGAQEVSVLIDKFGGGISHVLGTGGRDVKASVGGKMMLMGLDALAADPQTQVIGIVSKPPYPSVLKKILAKLNTIDKPVVACFLGEATEVFEGTKVIGCKTLESIAAKLVELEKGHAPKLDPLPTLQTLPIDGKFIRGLYTGGTLAYEAMLLLQSEVGHVYSNIAIDSTFSLTDVEVSQQHTILDMGEDYFTDGMPHPMIDPRLRSERIKKEVADPETAVILLDCVLGYGSHPDPAGAIVKAIESARSAYPTRNIHYVATVCGTDADPQNGIQQRNQLIAAGIHVLPTNAQAARFAGWLLKEGIHE
jgi:FdrA protein